MVRVRCAWPISACQPVCAAVALCGVLQRAGLSCVRCVSSERPACWRALRVFCVVCFPRGVLLAPGPVPWCWQAACLSNVPLGPAFLRRASSGSVALVALVGFPVAVVPFPTSLPGYNGRLAQKADSWCVPLAPAAAGAQGSLRGVPVSSTAVGLALAGPSGVRLGLRELPGTRLVPRADSCGRRHIPHRLRGRHTWVCVCVCLWVCSRPCRRPGRVRQAGLPGALWCGSAFLFSFFRGPLCSVRPPTLFSAALVYAFMLFSAPDALGLGALWSWPPPLLFFP